MGDPILVTGGAGYIGSHACKALAQAGYIPVTFDNFATGWREAVQFGPLEEGDLRNRARLEQVLRTYQPVAVMHFAALSNVGEASQDPGLYWDNNVIGSLRLLEAMAATKTKRLVFSSTCATYGAQDGVMLDETCAQDPLNAYGASKRAAEDLIRNFAAATEGMLEHVMFRYFNVAGADPDGQIGEFHQPETHLIPLALDAIAGRCARLTIFGQDYPTPDGTCIRDYVHVSDLVAAHILGLDYLRQGRGSGVFNLGTGHGFSVREVIETVAQVTGQTVPTAAGSRRPGDCAALVSGSYKAGDILGWHPDRSTLEQMIATAWAWHQRRGYRA